MEKELFKCKHGHIGEPYIYKVNGNKRCFECRRISNRKYSLRRKYDPVQKKATRDRTRFGGNREKAIERDEFKCVDCQMTRVEHFEKYGRDITVDHIVGNGVYDKNSPVPNNDLDNLQTLCLPCHSKKDTQRRGAAIEAKKRESDTPARYGVVNSPAFSISGDLWKAHLHLKKVFEGTR